MVEVGWGGVVCIEMCVGIVPHIEHIPWWRSPVVSFTSQWAGLAKNMSRLDPPVGFFLSTLGCCTQLL